MEIKDNKVIMTIPEMLSMVRKYDNKSPARHCNQCIYYINDKCIIRRSCANRAKEIR